MVPHRGAFLDENVGGFDIGMNEATEMQVMESVEKLNRNLTKKFARQTGTTLRHAVPSRGCGCAVPLTVGGQRVPGVDTTRWRGSLEQW